MSLEQQGITTEIVVIMKIAIYVTSEKPVEYAKIYNKLANNEIRT